MNASWPVLDGAYVVGDPEAPVAVCALTSEPLIGPLARLPGVAIAGRVYTANLGIERIVTNITSNPAIRFLLLCGKESKIFRPGQSLAALVDGGVDGEGRIVDAQGYDPVLPSLSAAQVASFRRQVELVDWTGEEDLEALGANIGALVGRSPGRFSGEMPAIEPKKQENFVTIRPGGKREPLQYDPKGYFVITLDREEEQIVLRHYLPDHTPAHEMRGRVATSMLLGLVREGLISQLSHAGYMGEELAKAEAALRLDLVYHQDRPLRRMPAPAAAPEAQSEAPAEPPRPRVPPPFTWNQVEAAAEGSTVYVGLAVSETPSNGVFSGLFLEPGEADPYGSFRRTDHPLTVATSEGTKTVMGAPEDVVAGAIVRVHGTLQPDHRVEAMTVVVLTSVATVE